MFIIAATKGLNDNTKGFRFNFFGAKGLVRIRKHKSRGFFKTERGECMDMLHLGKITVYRERKDNRTGSRILCHFAG
jgi:hypothetical protein